MNATTRPTPRAISATAKCGSKRTEGTGHGRGLIVRSVVMDAIPSPLQAILNLFATTLADVRFADLDAKTLASLASEVEAAAAVVESAEAALAAARGTLQ